MNDAREVINDLHVRAMRKDPVARRALNALVLQALGCAEIVEEFATTEERWGQRFERPLARPNDATSMQTVFARSMLKLLVEVSSVSEDVQAAANAVLAQYSIEEAIRTGNYSCG